MARNAWDWLQKGNLLITPFAQVLRFIAEEMGRRSAGHLREMVRREKAFQETKEGEFIPYALAHFLTVGLPSGEGSSPQDV